MASSPDNRILHRGIALLLVYLLKLMIELLSS